MDWLQVVRYTSPDDGGVFLVDTAPQFRGISGMDYRFLSWGMRPSLFDAPAIVGVSGDWWADARLVGSPDALTTPVIAPLGKSATSVSAATAPATTTVRRHHKPT